MIATGTRRRAAALPPDERRSMIIEATIPLLVEHGEMVTTRQIADAAGIAEGTIFRAFADKEELLAAVIESVLDPTPLEREFNALDPSLPLEPLVTAAVVVAQRRVLEVWQLISSVGPRMHTHKRRTMAESPGLTRLFEAHRDELVLSPRAAARALRSYTFAMSHPMLVDRPASPASITRLFLYGAAKDRPSC